MGINVLVDVLALASRGCFKMIWNLGAVDPIPKSVNQCLKLITRTKPVTNGWAKTTLTLSAGSCHFHARGRSTPHPRRKGIGTWTRVGYATLTRQEAPSTHSKSIRRDRRHQQGCDSQHLLPWPSSASLLCPLWYPSLCAFEPPCLSQPSHPWPS